MEVEEGNTMEGDESPTHIIEPQVELDEDLDHGALEPSVELNENMVEPQVELEEGGEHTEGNVYPFDTLAVEFYEGADAAADSSNADYPETEAASQEFQDESALLNGDSLSNSTSLDADEMSMDTSNADMVDSSLKEDDTNYNEMQRTYLKDFFSSSASPSDESSNPSFERIPLSRFPSIVKVVERAEYETIQILYQLLYQRSAWDTQEILSKRILEFSGFNFGKSSEEFYNREVMLQTLPNTVLVKIGAILCLDQVRNVLSNVGLGRHDLINAIMEFLSLPKKKTRASRISNNTGDNKSNAQKVEPCGCRNNCLTKFTPAERELLATHHASLPKKKADAYFLSLIQCQQATKRPDDDAKKHRDYKYNYKVKIGKKNVGVCKGGFMMLHNVKMSRLNHLQLRLKSNNFPKSLIAAVEYPFVEGQEEEEESPKNEEPTTATESTTDATSSIPAEKKDNLKVDDEIKKTISKKVPAVVVEKIDPVKITPQAIAGLQNVKKKSIKDDTKDNAEDPADKKNDNTKKKLKDFPLVVKSLDEASETLLIDLHFLLFSTSADSEKVKENILNFDGFSFGKDCEEYDERNEFLQRMSGKLITDVAKAFSLGVTSKREETIQNILSFLMKPDESYLESTTASVPVILSDVELDDIDGFSDSDESITCEVVEKKVECIDLLSSGEDSDKEDGKKKSSVKKGKVAAPAKVTPTPVAQTTSVLVSSNTTITTSQTVESTTESSKAESSGGIRRLKDFETIRKIVNTHPPEYLVDIYELLFLRKHDPGTLREEILDFSGFTFEKGSQEYVKRKQVLDRMLYNNVRRVYNTLIHNSTEVKVFSKPTMINEIFQFLFKLPDHDTSVRPLPPGAKTLMPKQSTSIPVAKINQLKPTAVATAPPTSAPASVLPSQTGKLSDLKRVFQRVACFPCEYLVDVHKLLFMTDCDPKVIRQNIFGFKGFNFSVDSTEFQQRKMYLEYLTFHSLRKISSVLTTRSVDLRNSTKHELASHLTDVLAEYCNSGSNSGDSAKDAASSTKADTPTTTTVENIVVTPIIQGTKSVSSTASSSSKNVTPKTSGDSLKISIVETRSISSPSVSTSKTSPNKGSRKRKSQTVQQMSIVETRSISSPSVSTSKTSPNKGSRKRKSQTVRQMVSEKKVAPAPAATTQPSDFADIHLPEVEQYRQIYGTNLNVYPSVPTITGIASFGSAVPQTFSQLVPQAMTFPIVSPYPQQIQVSGMQQPSQMIGLQSTALTMTTPIISQVTSKAPEVIVPADIEQTASESKTQTPAEKESPNKDKDSEEDGDQPLASLIGHPTDAVLRKHISDIVDKTDLQDITMNGVIQRIYDMYPKFDLSYRKEFIKSSLRTILYKLGEKSDSKEGSRDSNSPDCSVTTSDILDNSESIESSA